MFLFENNIVAQTNLIQNGSFELCNIPINWSGSNGGFYDVSIIPPAKIVLNWETFNSPDYFSITYPYANNLYSLPENWFGVAITKSGIAYAGISTYQGNNTDYKEYIYQNLSSPLKPDSVYCLSFFVTMADRLQIAVKNLGAYFSVNVPNLTSFNYINATPQIVNTSGFLTDTINWVEIQGCFTALGGEQYITIGSFGDRFNTDTLNVISTNPLTGTGNNFSYYYIDSVRLWQNNFPTAITELNKNKLVNVYPNPANAVINFKFKDATEKRKIELYDSIGELILSEAAPTQNSSLNIHHLANGIYFYSILVNGTTVNTNKIVIIK